MNRQYFEAVRLERTVMFFLLFFIVIVAAFGIMSTLITVTVQKRREIGIVKALGANIGQIIWVFLGQGTIVGFFGTLTGLGFGMTLIRYRNEFSHWLASTLHIEIFPREVYQFSSIQRSRSARCYHHLHQRLLNLFIGSADPCVLRGAARSGRIAPLRIICSNSSIIRSSSNRP